MNEIKGLTAVFEQLSKVVVNDEAVEEYEKQQQEALKKKKHNLYKQSGVPYKFFEESFDTFVATADDEIMQKKKVKDFADNPCNKVLILTGNNGTGKSHLGCSVIRQCGGVFKNSTELCIEYESGGDYNAKKNRLEILDYYIHLRMLVIDECGKYTVKQDTERFLLSYIVNNRYENDLPTVLITNGGKKEFVEFLGKSTYDRLCEVCTTVDFLGKSKRGCDRR